jgi:hypothetical protein
LRYVRFKAGEAPGDPVAFTLPPDGAGSQAMSPGVTGLPGGRFLLVWTEGPEGKHQVRAQTLKDSGDPIGDAMTVSADGVNAGQPQAASTADGRGVVAFLAAASGKAFDMIAVPVACPM